MRVFLNLVLFAAAANARAPSADQLAVVKDQFIGSLLTRDVPGLANFTPSALLHVNYSGVVVTKPGQRLQYNQTAKQPSFILESNLTRSDRIAVFLFDAAQPGNGTIEYDHYGEYYLRGSKHVTGSGNSTNVVAPYVAPADLAPGTGPHRYVVLAPANYSIYTGSPRTPFFNFTTYYAASGLGPIIAGTYFTAEDDSVPLQVTVAPTRPVNISAVYAGKTGSAVFLAPTGGATPSSGS